MKNYIFLHMTKTAGGTLKEAIVKLPDYSVQTVYSRADRENLDPETCNLVYGHALYGLHERLGWAPNYLTVLRHPLRRVVSHYYHLRNNDTSRVGQLVKSSSGINDFFENSRHWEFENLMCKVIVGETRPQVSDDELFQRARRNIEDCFVFIGIQEFFDLSMLLLSRTLNQDISTKRNVNVGEYDFADVDGNCIHEIVRRNSADILLYNWALERFLKEAVGAGVRTDRTTQGDALETSP